jgi:hypothetical protein
VIFGSYPPVPGTATAATISAVRRAWAAGEEVRVVSPRPSAADDVVRLSGLAAGPRLERYRRRIVGTPPGDDGSVAADAGPGRPSLQLVLGMEPGVPLPLADRRWPWLAPAHQWMTLRAMLPVLRRFDSLTVLVTGDLGVSTRLLGPLWSLADQILVTPGVPHSGTSSGLGDGTERAALADRLGVPPDRLELVDGPPDAPTGGLYPEGITPLGPVEVLLRDRPLWLVGWVARKVLGRYFLVVRAQVIFAGRRLRRVMRPIPRLARSGPLRSQAGRPDR